MRTLKRSLCLILCLAMMVGLLAIGASGAAEKFEDYKDKDTVTYESAVTLLTALKVLEGDDKGNFRPTDELNRAEGAAIMTRLLQKEIDKTAVSSFTDMAGYTWAQPYVKFCEDQGIIAGYGDGRFGPGDKLTTSQFAKMLIVALGYDPIKEGLVNDAAWEINTTRKVTSLSLAKGLQAYLPSKNLQREQAAQLAYNTLFSTMVYSEGSSIAVSWVGNLLKGGEAVITVTEGTPIPNPTYDYNTNNPIDNVLQFCEAAFPELKLSTGADAFAVPTNYWFKGKNATDRIYADSKLICTTDAATLLAKYTDDVAKVSGYSLYTDSGWADYIEVFENGEGLDLFAYDEYYGITRPGLFAGMIGDYRGAEILVYDMTDLYDQGYKIPFRIPDEDAAPTVARVIVKYPYLAQVIGVLAGETRQVSLKIYKEVGQMVTASVPSADYKKGDFVLIYPWGLIETTKLYDSGDFEDNCLLLKTPGVKNGTLNTVSLETRDNFGYAQSLTIAGEKLPIGSEELAILGPDAAQNTHASKDKWEIGTGITAFMSNGFILGCIPDAIAYGDWVFVYNHDGHGVGSAWDVTVENVVVGYLNQSAKMFETKVQIDAGVAPDVWYWTTVDNGVLTGKNETGKPDDSVYRVNKDGDLFEYGLRHDMAELAIDQDGNKIIADSKTVFVLQTGTAKFKAYVGIHNVPDYAWATTSGSDIPREEIPVGHVYALVPYEGAHAVAVFINVTGMKGVTPEDADPVFLLGMFPTTKTGDDGQTPVWTYPCIKDGKLDVLVCTKKIDRFTIEGLVIPIYDASGKYVVGYKEIEASSKYILLNAGGVTCTFENDTITFGDNTYVVALDAVAYVYNRQTGKLTVTTPDCLPGLPMADVTAIARKSDMQIQTIYYVYPSKMDPV